MNEDLIEISATHLREDTPEIRETLDRLLAEGHSHADAKMLIARALSVEMNNMFKEGKPFDTERLLRNLKALPKAPSR